MTRINANLPPKSLHRRHLVAELREITMVPAALTRSRRTQPDAKILLSIPDKFCLGNNHVKFFYNKLEFLKRRFEMLCDEMSRRGYTPDRSRVSAFDGFPEIFNNSWEASDVDNKIVIDRITERIAQKPHLYI